MLNEKQNECLKYYKENCISTRLFIDGGAGTGKTFTAEHIINAHTSNNDGIVMVVSFTNQAVKNIKEMSSNAGSNVMFSTIHKYLKLIPSLSGDDGKEKLEFESFSDIDYSDVSMLIIDEIMAIDNDLIKMCFDTLTNAAIVVLGDKFQLAPISGEQFNPKNSGFTEIELTQQMRQENLNAGLYKTVSELREVIRAGSVNKYSLKHFDETIEEVDSLIELQVDGRIDVIACFTNATVCAYNEAIHENLTGYKHPQVGDELVLYQPIRSKVFTGKETIVKTLAPNGDIVTIDEIRGNNYILRTEYGTLSEPVHLYYDLTNPYEEWKEKFQGTSAEWARIKKGLKIDREVYSWANYRDYKSVKARLPYSITSYKLQGSSYVNVGINELDMSVARDNDTYNRLLYVALSRARKKAYIVR